MLTEVPLDGPSLRPPFLTKEEAMVGGDSFLCKCEISYERPHHAWESPSCHVNKHSLVAPCPLVSDPSLGQCFSLSALSQHRRSEA